jgi:hypothetical protein
MGGWHPLSEITRGPRPGGYLHSCSIATRAYAPGTGAHPSCEPPPPSASGSERAGRGSGSELVLALGLAAAFIALGFLTTGGFDGSGTVSTGDTWTEIVVILIGTAALGALLVQGLRRPVWGVTPLLLLGAVTVLTGLSIIWSVQPDASWQASSLALAYLMVFALGLVLARLMPSRWRALLVGLGAAAAVLSGYALLAKVFPASLAASESQGRLQAPLGYWNATGALAAMGLVPCLWAFGHRPGPRALAAGAVPATVILTSAVILSLSRTALVVAIIGLAAWLVFVPGRLRISALLALAAPGTAVICGWALAHNGLTGDGAGLAARTNQGHAFGLVLLVTLLLTAAAGLAAAFPGSQIKLSDRLRRRLGIVLIGGVALLPVVAVVALAESSRGLTGEISHGWQSLVSYGQVSGTASRLTELGSSRPLYWSEGITVGEHALLKGVGALGYATARTRYTTATPDVAHAHSYLVQTFADLGLLGLVASLALAVAWLISAARTLEVARRWSGLDAQRRAERAGLLALTLVVVVCAVVSCADWTYYFPTVTIPAALAAGWVAGRGPLARPGEPAPEHSPITARPGTAAAVALLAALGLIGAWAVWQPLRSSQEATAALVEASDGHGAAAFDDAHSAVAADPMALQPRFVLSSLLAAAGQPTAARNELLNAIREQPQNFDSWLQLGDFDLRAHHPRLALVSLEHARGLYPTYFTTGVLIGRAQAELGR